MTGNAEIRPNLFIIGAARSGTSSLHFHLDRHPDVFMSRPKEPAFFVPEIDAFPKDPEWYLGLFAEAGDARIVGESSTHYTKRPIYEGVAERIATFCGAPRFIYLVRDPIDRIVSQFWHDSRQFVEHREMLPAVRDEVKYRAISDYRMQLEPYFEVFGRDRVLVLVFEELVSRTEHVLDKVFRWLDLDPDRAPDRLEQRNARPEEMEITRGRGRLFRFAKSSFWDALSPYVPSFFKDFGKEMIYQRVKPSDVEVEEVVEFLRPGQREKVRELSAFLGRDFPHWTTTLGEASSAESDALAAK